MDAADPKSDTASRVADRFRKVAEGDFQSVEGQIRRLMEAVRHMETAKTAMGNVLSQLPEDKGALKIQKDCETQIKRMNKEMEDLRKQARSIAEKTIAPELKKLAADVVKAVRAQLVDPKKLQVIPWQTEVTIQGASRYDRATRAQVPAILLRIDDPGLGHDKRRQLVLYREPSGVLRAPMPGYYGEPVPAPPPKEIAAAFIKLLGTWDGVKGLSDQRAKWKATADKIKPLFESALSRLGSYGSDGVEVSADGRTLSGSYRSSLPKEGDHGIDEYEYDEMVKREYARADKGLDSALGHMKSEIDKISRHVGDKGWIEISIHLK